MAVAVHVEAPRAPSAPNLWAMSKPDSLRDLVSEAVINAAKLVVDDLGRAGEAGLDLAARVGRLIGNLDPLGIVRKFDGYQEVYDDLMTD